ncbi:MAG: alpha/beta hydrolase [Bacteroidota bacterium]|nr:alpha/beta hydrolase [Bacteroidota bacterium]
MRRDIVLNGATIRLEELYYSKEKPTLVFLHDSLGSIALWRDFPKILGERTACNVVVYDRQGYGQSSPLKTAERGNDYLEIEANGLHQLLEKQQLKNVILFGHSDGGSIALIAAAKYPAHIAGIITEGAHIFVEEITLEGIREAVKLYKATNLKERLQKYHGEKTEAVFAAWTKTWLNEGFRTWNIENFLPQIQCPALIMQGEKDEYGSEAQVDGIVNHIAGKAKKLMIPSIGHTPHKEAREVVLAQAAAFINALKTNT